MAGHLFHSVTTWTAPPAEEGSDVTPGRIGHVFFFPAKSYQALDGKKPRWFIETRGGDLDKESV